MPKKIPCSCTQGYHYSKAEKTKCRRTNGHLLPSTQSVIDLQAQRIHHNQCQCELCQEIRVQRLISYFTLPINRYKLLSQSEMSEEQPAKPFEISKVRQQKLGNTPHETIIWDEQNIKKLMQIGAGNLNLKTFEAIKSRRLKTRRNQTFLRMYLFLNPQTSIIVSDWGQIVMPRQLMLEQSRPIDSRSYQQRVEDRLNALAKKCKQLHINSKDTYFRTHQMMDIEEKIDNLTAIVQKFSFIQEYEDLLAQKQQQKWEQNIIILKKGENRPHAIHKFTDLKAVAPFFQPPIRKKSNLHLINKKQHLDRRYEKVRREARYYGLIQRPNFISEIDLLEELHFKLNTTHHTKKMEIELQLKRTVLAQDAQKMDIESPKIKFSEDSNNTEIYSRQHEEKNYFNGRSYLFPRVVIMGTNIPMTIGQIYSGITKIMNSPFNQEEKQSTVSKMQSETRSKSVQSIIVSSEQKSIVQSDWQAKSVSIDRPKPMVRQFNPRSNIKLYSLNDINNFPKPKVDKNHFECLDFQRCSQLGCSEWLNGSVLECAVCYALYHSGCWASNNLFCVCQSTKIDLRFDFCAFYMSDRFSRFNPMGKILVPPQQPLFPEETLMAIRQIEQNLQKQAYCVTNCFHDHFTIYSFYNSELCQLHAADQDIIDLYDSRKYAFPVIVKEISSTKGKGLVARKPISKGQLVATYSGNVISLAQVAKYADKSIKDYMFHLISGPDVQTNFVVYPKDYASPGFFMNHADFRTNKKRINVKTLIALHKNGPIVLMQASKNINYGEELLYDYNGEYDSYDTQGFE